MTTTIQKDITTVIEGIICHQVNCQGVMGAGLAKQIRAKFPNAYTDYMEAHRKGRLVLGNVIFSIESATPPLYIANLCGQNMYGREKGRVYTNYASVRKCLTTVATSREYNFTKSQIYLPIYIPFNMGCSLAGGNWPTILEIIKETIPDAIIAKYG